MCTRESRETVLILKFQASAGLSEAASFVVKEQRDIYFFKLIKHLVFLITVIGPQDSNGTRVLKTKGEKH